VTEVPRYMHRLARGEMTARRAGLWISGVTVVVTLIAGVVMWLVDDEPDIPTVWVGLWWAVQTVTTVGYGDVVPDTKAGKGIATIVMLTGIAFVAVATAAITAVFVESARRRLREAGVEDELDRHAEIIERLERIETRLRDSV
jgi:voltage-gated potassium channel